MCICVAQPRAWKKLERGRGWLPSHLGLPGFKTILLDTVLTILIHHHPFLYITIIIYPFISIFVHSHLFSSGIAKKINKYAKRNLRFLFFTQIMFQVVAGFYLVIIALLVCSRTHHHQNDLSSSSSLGHSRPTAGMASWIVGWWPVWENKLLTFHYSGIRAFGLDGIVGWWPDLPKWFSHL